MKSPFEYTTPEAISAQDVHDLFVPVFSEYLNVPSTGHTFIHGFRGCGKSMMFRYMNPDCQCINTGKRVHQLDYFAITIAVKEGLFDKSDLELLKDRGHGEALLNEHLMVITFAIKIFEALGNTNFSDSKNEIEATKVFYNSWLTENLNYCGWNENLPKIELLNTLSDIFNAIKKLFTSILREFTKKYLHLLIGNPEPLPYRGAICIFVDFLYPLIQELKKIDIFPKAPIYLLVDDADNLNLIQTMILNQWVSMRTTKDVCFKVSTQLKYKSYRTINGSRIDTPHDYTEINISDIYTSQKGLYKRRVKEAIERRLNKYGFPDVSAEDFFPVDKIQANKIKLKYEKYNAEKGHDYAYRYTIPDFIRDDLGDTIPDFIRDDLEGNRYAFSYAGFDQLVNISSGIMRYFIDFAHRMFIRQITDSDNKRIMCIKAGIQDIEIKKYSFWFLEEEFEKLKLDNIEADSNNYSKLGNLIQALGQMFHVILMSKSSERRVFSVALNDEPSKGLKEILDLGVECGYLQKSLIGNKTGTGRAKLYILSRLLSPYFKLDPSSFAGYKFMLSEDLEKALENPAKFVSHIKRKGSRMFFQEESFGQLSLFQNENEL